MEQNSSSLVSDQSKKSSSPFKIKDELIITDPLHISCLVHEKKQIILKFLIKSDYTIRELSRDTNINPGTVKRHLNDMEQLGLVKFVRQEKNEYGIILKFYRAVSKKFKVDFELT